jgi:hypothetical protein
LRHNPLATVPLNNSGTDIYFYTAAIADAET